MVRGPQAGCSLAQVHDARLDGGRHLVGQLAGRAGCVGQGADATGGVPAQPAVHRLARDLVAEGGLGDAEAAEDLQHCLVALLHDSQLDEHVPALPRFVDRLGRLSREGGTR